MTIFCLADCAIGVTQERTAAPSIWTVQAPHWPSPQPKRGPCSSEIVAQRVKQRHVRVVVVIDTRLPFTLSDSF